MALEATLCVVDDEEDVPEAAGEGSGKNGVGGEGGDAGRSGVGQLSAGEKAGNSEPQLQALFLFSSRAHTHPCTRKHKQIYSEQQSTDARVAQACGTVLLLEDIRATSSTRARTPT